MNCVGLIEVLKAGLLPYIDNIDNNVRLNWAWIINQPHLQNGGQRVSARYGRFH